MKITHERLLEVLNYDAEIGIFSWRSKPRCAPKDGLPGCLDHHGYWRIGIDYGRYWAHRLAWFYVQGVWPVGEIDHINGDPLDNRISNLREATRGQNAANGRTRKDSKLGLKGVSFHAKTGKWAARSQKDGKRVSFGYFHTPEEAHHAYVVGSTKLHGEFARAA